ncbi:triphosphoribosyl-dephospho-CoA synthase MdcB [Lichenicoccus sp.]|uniref:triphosphoribosyl-dephospho-CoA synthase MdcB n=1 Tax=Lichenicoccus sp. TaxID=2781899 RepID=UPI003D1108AC
MRDLDALLDAPPARRDDQLVARLATDALLAEVAAWPKPGLVSDRDSGSHADMDAAMLRASARVLTPYFAELAAAGRAGRGMPALRGIGLRAEAAMLRTTGGINTHRGAIFGLGLICAAAGLRAASPQLAPSRLGTLVHERWGQEIRAVAPTASHGADARRRFGAGGARLEAATGFGHVYQVALPALRAARAKGADERTAHVQACFALLAVLGDTNLLHRGGRDGLAFARQAARRFLADGGVLRRGWQLQAMRTHAAFVARGLSPGGSADLLALAIMVDRLEAAAREWHAA